MVYKTPFLKQVVVNDYDPPADGSYTWQLSDQPLGAVWITVKADVKAVDVDMAEVLAALTTIDVWMGGFNVVHYAHGIDAMIMNCKLKGAWPYCVNSSQVVDDVVGYTFPIMFGAPYLNEKMCLPDSHSNRKTLTLGVDIDTGVIDDVLLDIAEVILPGATPAGCIKQEEHAVATKGTGDQDLWLQTNWNLLKLNLRSPTVPTGTAFTSTIERAGLEINDFAFGYKSVPWEILHGELMDELEGAGPVEAHSHLVAGPLACGFPIHLESWIANFAELDFFFNFDLKWAAPLAGASTAKLKYNEGVAEAWRMTTACYVPAAML
jgi:hypothetical protein